jgi:hypothetical protein
MAASQQFSESKSAFNVTDRFPISPLIRITLMALYAVLMAPLPVLAGVSQYGGSPVWLTAGIGLGAIGLYGALAQVVKTNDQGIEVTYPGWFRWIYRGGWQLRWDDVTALKPRTTGQGGIVYYFVGKDQQAYLLPMRIAGFARLVRQVQAKTGIDTQDVKPLAQPWMYGILLGLTMLLGLVDVWTITTAIQLDGTLLP